MSRPGTTLTRSESPPSRSAPTATGPAFLVGLTGKGTAADARDSVKSLSEFVTRFGARSYAPYLYDVVDIFFKEGGDECFISRVFGPTPVTASGNLLDQSGSTAPGDVALVATAKSPGSYANTLNVAVIAGDAGGEFKIVVTDDTDTTINETSPSLVDRDAAVAWALASSEYILLTLGASNEDPRVQTAVSLAGGDDDRANATDATWLAAADRFTADLGPGQICFPGMTTAARHAQVLNHGQTYDRAAVLDAPDTATKATLLALNAGITAANANAKRFGGVFEGWQYVPGITAGTTRTVPPSAIVLGVIARNDGKGISPNQPSAGILGESLMSLGRVQAAWSDSDREALNEAGINVLKEVYGGVRIYGYRTLTSPTTDATWLNFASVRLFMAITAKANEIAERFVFREIDGQGLTISEFGGALTAMLLQYWESGSLYGATPEEAFFVDVGSSVNTEESIAAGYLKASIRLTTSEFAEEVVIDLVKTRIGEAVA